MNQEVRFSRLEPEQRKALLIEATLACLKRHGFQGASVRKICAEAGVSVGLINHHYDGKDALVAEAYLAVTGRVMRLLRGAIDTAPGGARPRLSAFFEASFSAELLDPQLLDAWLAFWVRWQHRSDRAGPRPFLWRVPGAAGRRAAATGGGGRLGGLRRGTGGHQPQRPARRAVAGVWAESRDLHAAAGRADLRGLGGWPGGGRPSPLPACDGSLLIVRSVVDRLLLAAEGAPAPSAHRPTTQNKKRPGPPEAQGDGDGSARIGGRRRPGDS